MGYSSGHRINMDIQRIECWWGAGRSLGGGSGMPAPQQKKKFCYIYYTAYHLPVSSCSSANLLYTAYHGFRPVRPIICYIYYTAYRVSHVSPPLVPWPSRKVIFSVQMFFPVCAYLPTGVAIYRIVFDLFVGNRTNNLRG